MAKQIVLTHEGKDYTLEFNRNGVMALERQGFTFDELGTKPLTMIPLLVAGAFKMHHSYLDRKKVDAIYAAVADKSRFIQCLAEMYSEPVMTLIEDQEASGGNAEWEPSW